MRTILIRPTGKRVLRNAEPDAHGILIPESHIGPLIESVMPQDIVFVLNSGKFLRSSKPSYLGYEVTSSLKKIDSSERSSAYEPRYRLPVTKLEMFDEEDVSRLFQSNLSGNERGFQLRVVKSPSKPSKLVKFQEILRKQSRRITFGRDSEHFVWDCKTRSFHTIKTYLDSADTSQLLNALTARLHRDKTFRETLLDNSADELISDFPLPNDAIRLSLALPSKPNAIDLVEERLLTPPKGFKRIWSDLRTSQFIWYTRERSFKSLEDFIDLLPSRELFYAVASRLRTDRAFRQAFENWTFRQRAWGIERLSGDAFEMLCETLVKEREGVVRVHKTPKGGDGGYDLKILLTDALGLKTTYLVSCKRWDDTIGPAVVRDLHSVVISKGASLGIVMTNSTFTSGAKDYAKNIPIHLMNGARISRLLGESTILHGTKGGLASSE